VHTSYPLARCNALDLSRLVTSARARHEANAEAARRARAWHHARHADICDVIRPWQHGTVVRATRYPSYYDFNLVRVEQDPQMDAAALAEIADEALEGLEHRRIDVEVMDCADRLLPDFGADGWRWLRMVLMRYEGSPAAVSSAPVEEVPYDAAHELRVLRHREDFPEEDARGYHEEAREVALRRGTRVLAHVAGGMPVAFAALERSGDGAEISSLYVRPERRGRGLGTALTRAAIRTAGDVRDLWIGADDDGRPKELYARLGFRPAWSVLELTRLP
jgi:GNAT superfamily N-acetyltransferase